MEVNFRKFIRENVIFANETMDSFLFQINNKKYLLSWNLSYYKALKENKWINPITNDKNFLPESFYKNYDFNLISVNPLYGDIFDLMWYYKKIKESYPLNNIK